MTNQKKFIIKVVGFMAFIAIAVFAYNKLSKDILPKDTLSNGGNKPTTESDNEQALTLAPDITLFDKDGNEVLLSQMRGKPVVINFWASWCPPCKSEMPYFNKVYKEMGDDITFLMVDMVDGQRETTADGKQYVEEQGFTFPVYFDSEGDASMSYNVTSLPTTIFINKDGYMVTGVKGAINEETLRSGIEMIK